MDFKEKNSNDWQNIVKTIFPNEIPERYTWHDTKSISKVLNTIGIVRNSNHAFFPSGGGLDIKGCKVSPSEKGCIEMDFVLAHIGKPKQLMFESFNGDMQWNYFRLELDTLPKVELVEEEEEEITPQHDVFDEELTELFPGDYVHRSYWDEQSYDGERLPSTARIVIRLLKGTIVFFQKTCIYNIANGKMDAYDGRHNKMNSEEFRTYVKQYMEAYNSALVTK